MRPVPEQPPIDASRFRAPIGTHDVLPQDSERWISFVATFAARAARYGFGLAITPIFEHVDVFQRVGESTDVVRKEMYDFEDKGGRRIALRPEGTAPVVRAFVQHRPPVPWKIWYVAPHFRYERPQKGRYRQHWQVGAEVLGVDDPEVDVEMIALAHGFYRDLGLRDVNLVINSMGDEHSRPAYVALLREYLLDHAAGLGDTFRERVEANPLRVLDSKVEDWQNVIERAPQLTEHLSDESRESFETVQRRLDVLGIRYELAPRLVRGFDYYTGTTFEFQSAALDAAQNAIGGGGRYGKLAEEMGGPPTSGIGFGIGVERVLIACEAEGIATPDPAHADVFVVNGLGAEGSGEVAELVYELRESGVRAERTYGDRSVKAQFKVAGKSGARWSVMLGREEASRNVVAVKDLRSESGQIEVGRERLAEWLEMRRDEAKANEEDETAR
jgi:histidyl-tRNA synthetase